MGLIWATILAAGLTQRMKTLHYIMSRPTLHDSSIAQPTYCKPGWPGITRLWKGI